MFRIGKRFILIGIGLAILFAIIWSAKPAVLFGYLIKSDLSYILLAFTISSVLVVFRVIKWKVLLKGVGFLEIFPVQLFGMAISNLTPGKIGEPAKALLLKARKGISVSASLPTIIWERVADVVILIILSFAAIQLISTGSKVFMLSFLSVAAFAFMIVLMLVILYSKRFGMRAISFFRGFPVLRKIDKNFMKTFYKFRIEKKRLLACFLLTGVPWVMEGVTMYFCFMALGVNTQPLLLSSIIALSVLIGVMSSLPGGLGSTDAVMIILLGLVGVEGSIATAGMLLYRFMTFWYGIFLGGLSFLYLSKKIDVKKIIK
ncbi:MAG: flippase-like domain-containing protein [Candidatus Aenigmarchaeota archaeon]|nr:flippase-like domain-containing protein [Candidatus Aenigmarchaeota archaeon]